jgi:hypothetical protein
LGDNIKFSLSGIFEDSYKPLHPQYVSATRAAKLESERARDIQEIRTRIEEELHNHAK